MADQTSTPYLYYCCDVCKAYPIIDFRYRCQSCEDFDICQDCYRKKVHIQTHKMTKIAISKDKLWYNEAALNKKELKSSLAARQPGTSELTIAKNILTRLRFGINTVNQIKRGESKTFLAYYEHLVASYAFNLGDSIVESSKEMNVDNMDLSTIIEQLDVQVSKVFALIALAFADIRFDERLKDDASKTEYIPLLQQSPSSQVSLRAVLLAFTDLLMLYDKFSWFSVPVSRSVPNYYNVVKNPTDLGGIKKSIQNQTNIQFNTVTRRSFGTFAQELRRVWTNSIDFNPVNHPIYEFAVVCERLSSEALYYLSSLFSEIPMRMFNEIDGFGHWCIQPHTTAIAVSVPPAITPKPKLSSSSVSSKASTAGRRSKPVTPNYRPSMAVLKDNKSVTNPVVGKSLKRGLSSSSVTASKKLKLANEAAKELANSSSINLGEEILKIKSNIKLIHLKLNTITDILNKNLVGKSKSNV